MAVPHIRFDGSSKKLEDVKINTKVQNWNHRQVDAHGLFLLALNDALTRGLVKVEDLAEDRIAVICKFPSFFNAIKYWQYEDSGAWEEIERRNTSSIAAVSQSLYRLSEWPDSKLKNKSTLASQCKLAAKLWSSKELKSLHRKGLKTVKRQLNLGGESPSYANLSNPKFRLADAALFNVIVPEPLQGLKQKDYRKVVSIIESLKRPAGILRYLNDSYQAANYWIRDPKSKKATIKISANSSSKENYSKRFSTLTPNTEAQWFFDSKPA